ncbi:Amidohydrolase [compost metagenome]
MLVDAHHHLWRLSRGDYSWLTPDDKVLYRDHEAHEYETLLKHHQIDRSVLIQAAPSLAETAFLLETADAHAFIGAVVGWVDFECAEAVETLKTLACAPKFRGVRPMIQSISDPAWMLNPAFDRVFEALIAHDLSFDALVQPEHLAHLRTLSKRHPALRMAINHCGKPQVKCWRSGDADFSAWADNMRALASNPAVYCKLSALPTRAAPHWAAEDFSPYVEMLWESFGAQRLMWASDWPVLHRNGRYDNWLAVARALVAQGSHAQVFGKNAQAFYRLDDLQCGNK